ncbi:MAG: SIS domain-containing protein [Chloroflexota bacterium]
MSDANSIMPIADTKREVAEQPSVIARVLRELQDTIQETAATLAERNIAQIILLGSGDSWFAGQMVRLALEQYAGMRVEPMQAYEYAAYGCPGIDEKTAVVVISSSGRPTTTWDALDLALKTPAYVIGISDNPYEGNPFIEKPDVALLPNASKKGLPAQTTTATVAILIDLAIELGRANGYLSTKQADDCLVQLRSMPDKMTDVLRESAKVVSTFVETAADKRFFTLVGGGPSYGVACVGSALLAEGPQAVGLPLTVEEFHHGLRFGTIGQDEAVILIAPNGQVNQRNLDTANSVNNWIAKLVAIVDETDETISPLADTTFTVPSVPEPMSPLLTILPLHNLAIQLAEQKMSNGYQRPSKVP